MEDHIGAEGCVLCIGEGEEIAEAAYDLENAGFSVLRARYLDDISRSAAPFSILAFVITGDPQAPSLCRRLRSNIRYAFTPLFVLAQPEAKLRLDLITAGADDCGPFPQGYLAQAIRTRQHRQSSLRGALLAGPEQSARLSIEQLIPREIARAHRYKSVFCLSLIDVDIPLLAADAPNLLEAMIAAVGESFRYGLRDADIISQSAPSGFTLLLPHATGEGAQIAIERCIQLLSGINLEGYPNHKASFSAGIAPLHSKDRTAQDLLLRANSALLLAKQKGPRSIVLAS